MKNPKWIENQPKILRRTEEREKYISSQPDVQLHSIWECEFNALKKSCEKLQHFLNNRWKTCLSAKPSEEEILEAVLNEKFSGFLCVDISVPTTWNSVVKNRPDFKDRFQNRNPTEYFSEMPPLFMNCEIKFEDIGQLMQRHAEMFNVPKNPRKLLVSGLSAEELLLHSELLRYYLILGLQVTKIHSVYEFDSGSVFKSFQQSVTNDRLNGSTEAEKSTVKLIGIFYSFL